MLRYLVHIAIVGAIAAASAAVVAQQRPPLPQGTQITAQDGDTIILAGDARVRIVRSRDADVRVVFNAAERWVILLADFAVAGKPDGRVDMAYHFSGIGGEWPMEDRWQGRATLLEYSVVPGGPSSTAFTGPRGLVQFVSPAGPEELRDPNAIAHLSWGSGGGGTADGVSFDEAERRELAELRGESGTRGGRTTGARVEFVIPGGETPSGSSARTPDGAVRVGGGVRVPGKLVDVAPVMPEQAIRAGIKGIVIAEITVGVDGTVTDARILRSIPLLDQAALDAVRQWRYTPTMVEGRPVPVVMTVTVSFP